MFFSRISKLFLVGYRGLSNTTSKRNEENETARKKDRQHGKAERSFLKIFLFLRKYGIFQGFFEMAGVSGNRTRLGTV